MDELADAGPHRLLQQQVGAIDVDGTQQPLVLGQGHLGDVVEHDVDAGYRARDELAIADVADEQFDARWTLVRVVQVHHSHLVAGIDQTLHEQRAEVPATTGDEADLGRCSHYSSIPCSTHQRMLRRMPSYSSTVGV